MNTTTTTSRTDYGRIVTLSNSPKSFTYSKWRDGGWYVLNVQHPEGGCGCVYRNRKTRRWHIACGQPDDAPTYKNRDDAARAEWMIANNAKVQP